VLNSYAKIRIYLFGTLHLALASLIWEPGPSLGQPDPAQPVGEATRRALGRAQLSRKFVLSVAQEHLKPGSSGNRYMAALLADRPTRPLQHRLALVAQHAIWTTYDLLSHVEAPFWCFAQRIRQAKRKLASDAQAVPPP
jgi:hypothetical protein